MADGSAMAAVKVLVVDDDPAIGDYMATFLGKDGFTSARAVEAQKDAQKLATRIEAALRDDSAPELDWQQLPVVQPMLLKMNSL